MNVIVQNNATNALGIAPFVFGLLSILSSAQGRTQMISVKKPSVAPSVTSLLSAALLVGASGMAFATPVMFTTNEVVNGAVVAINGPYRVSYITVFVDGVKKCYTESNGNCTATPQLAPGLHTARFVWATCNNPDSCPHYGEVTQIVDIPDQTGTYAVRIPTVRVQFDAPYGTGIGLNQQRRGWALGGNKYVANHMSGCYTTDYHEFYSETYPAWPSLPAAPDAIDTTPPSNFVGFGRLCIGSSDTYSAATSTAPHVVIPYPF
jgi:hypothetical protein